ncbi:DUF5305 family protein [Actinoplanes cyaneus]|nr:DUF5305 family protein [Actinoplanes cyaneus]
MMAAIAVWAVATHRVSYVVTHGVSMQPLYHADDLVLVIKSKSYKKGDIAAYNGAHGQVQVLHRIIGGDGESGFVFKGDNNPSVDSATPTADELVGRAFLHIPKGGTWLKPLLSPTGLGMLGFLFASGAATAKNRREIPRGRRKKRAKGMAGQGGSWAAASTVVKAVGRLSPIYRILAVLAALCAAAGLTLGVLGFMKPTTRTAPVGAQTGESMTFSYSAKVRPSAAYDGTVVYSPDPIFRRLADFANLQMQYQGEPGTINVDARLSTQGGWHSTMQLSQPRRFAAERYTGTVLLDLAGVEERVVAAGEAIGTNLGPVTILVTAHVKHADGAVFEPQLALGLDQTQLTLAKGLDSLTVTRSGTSSGGGLYPRQISVLGRDLMTAAVARKYALWFLVVAAAGAIGIGFAALRHVPLRTRKQIEQRYGHLLVPVEPMASKQGETVITVASVPALVKLAEKYGQMILTWTRPDGADDFVVRDDGVVYRYRIVPARPAAAKPPLSGMPHPARRTQKSAALGIASVIGSPAQTAAPEPEPTPEPSSAREPEPRHDVAGPTATKPETTADPQPEPETPAEQQPEPEAAAKQEPEPEAAAKPEPEPATEPEPTAKESAPAEKPQATLEAAKSEAAPEAERAEPKAAAEEPEEVEATPAEQATEAKIELQSAKEDTPTVPEVAAQNAEIEPTVEPETEPEAPAQLHVEPEPAVEQHTEAEPATQLPAELEPVAEQPAQPEPAAEQPAEPEIVAEQPAEPEIAAEQPAEPEIAAAGPAPDKAAQTVTETPAARTQPARRPRKPRVKPVPELEAKPATPAPEPPAATSPEAADEAAPEVATGAAPAVREEEQEPESAPGPRKQAARRKPRARKAVAVPPAAEAEAAPKRPTATRRKAAPEPPAERRTPVEETIEQEKAAEVLATERKAAEELAERNVALEEAIARKAEEDQAAADRARKERVAKRTASRDPVFDFLPKKD